MTGTPRLDAFTRAYIEAALWSSTAYGTPEEKACGAPDAFDRSFEDCVYGVDDLAPALLASVVEDCAAFQRAAADHIAAGCLRTTAAPYSDGEQAGHDFWLTRNGHGAGFWDGDWPEPAGDVLTTLSKTYRPQDWYMGDDGMIYAD